MCGSDEPRSHTPHFSDDTSASHVLLLGQIGNTEVTLLALPTSSINNGVPSLLYSDRFNSQGTNQGCLCTGCWLGLVAILALKRISQGLCRELNWAPSYDLKWAYSTSPGWQTSMKPWWNNWHMETELLGEKSTPVPPTSIFIWFFLSSSLSSL
jgi:hypothetical protein